MELPQLLKEVPGQALEEKFIQICKDSDIMIKPLGIKGWHRILLGRNTTNTTKHNIVRFVDRKHS